MKLTFDDVTDWILDHAAEGANEHLRMLRDWLHEMLKYTGGQVRHAELVEEMLNALGRNDMDRHDKLDDEDKSVWCDLSAHATAARGMCEELERSWLNPDLPQED